jgi:hypothetical protein
MSIELLSSCAVQSLSPSIEIRHETAQVQEVVRVLAALNQPQRLRVLDALRPAAGLHALLALIEHWRGPGAPLPALALPRLAAARAGQRLAALSLPSVPAHL